MMAQRFRDVAMIGVSIGVMALAAPAEARQIGERAPQVLIGVTFTQIGFDAAANLGVEWHKGFAAGVGFPIPIKNSPITINPEVLFVQKGGTVVSSVIEQIQLNYIQISPEVQLDVLPAIGGRTIVLTVAPTFNVNLSASNEVNGQKVNIKDAVERFETGLVFGAVTPLVKGILDVGGRVEWDLTRLFRNPHSTGKNRALLIFVRPHIFRE